MLNRRQAITGAIATAGVATATGGSEVSAQAIAVRRDVSLMDFNDPDLAAYREAVRVLRFAPRNPAVTWEAIAEIHNGYCPHGNWYFLPWHRAYVLMLERIVRDITGRANFAMPYWDWTESPSIPQVFLDPGTQSDPNPLFLGEPDRWMNASMAIPDEVAGPRRMLEITDQPSFRAFASGPALRDDGFEQDSADPALLRNRGEGGLLEGPHDSIHMMIGNGVQDGQIIQRQPNQPGGIMASFVSPLDPVFWVHHCNIDRRWAIWNRNGNQNTRNWRWRDMTFTDMFLAPDGTVISDPFTDLTNINLMEQTLELGYSYRIGADLPRLPQPDDELLIANNEVALRRGSVRSGGGGGGGGGLRSGQVRNAKVSAPAAPRRTTVVSPRNEKAATIGQPVEIPVTVAADRITAAVRVAPASPAAETNRSGSAGGGGALRSGALRSATTSAARIPPARPPSPGPRVIATISGLKPPGAKANATLYRVFVNKDGLQANTPTTDPSFVSAFSFFGANAPADVNRLRSGQTRSGAAAPSGQGGGHGGHGGHSAGAADAGESRQIDLTWALRRLAEQGKFKPGDPVRVQIVAVGSGDKADSAVVPARVAVSIK